MLSKTRIDSNAAGRWNYQMRYILLADGVRYFCKTRTDAQRFAISINAQRFLITRRATHQTPVGI